MRATNTKIEPQFPNGVLAILIGAFAFLVFFHLGNRPLVGYDEAIYAQVAREALQNHSQLGFTWLGNIVRQSRR